MAELFETLSRAAPEQTKSLTNALGDRFLLVPAGSFQMGSHADEAGHRINEEPVHEVVIGQPYYLGVHAVTQGSYKSVMGKNPARFHDRNGGGPNFPVENVSWEDAIAFCKLLSEHPEERAAGRTYRLPTEAEWEYACRCGTATPFGCGTELTTAQANHDALGRCSGSDSADASGRTAAVGSFPANLYGLMEMHGNVWEWCADWYDGNYYASSPVRDPKGPTSGRFRVLRGGSWRNQALACRSAYRNALAPFQRDSCTGFRVVLVLADQSGQPG